MAATVACPDCGTAVAPDARFCASCGTRQPERDGVTREVRKLATVVFADVTGSTALGERLDPEALRALMTRYFVAMRTVIERHGGRGEKVIGDAGVGGFGIPAGDEGDALRAARAAWGIREGLPELSQQLETERRVSIRFRTGINTGEVVAGDPLTGTTLVTGDTVNTAARLEQAAPPGEVLLGELTYWLVRDAVDAEPVEPVAAKGKAALISAYRLTGVRVRAEGRARRLDAPMVGRAAELDLVAAAWKEAVASAMPRLLTVLAPAGVGKSRLVREVILRVRGTGGVALVGRCLPYGDGITYWPIRELVHGAAGISEADDQTAARERVEALLRDAPDGVRVAARIGSAIGLSTDPAPLEEVFWAIRRLLAHLASAQPTLVVLEDLHWAEDTLLDLVDTLAGSELTGAVLVLTTARPELAERREGSLASRPVTDVLRLGPLGNDDAGELLDALPGGAALPPSVRDRMLTAAEGNPLYVEELLGLLRDEGKIRESASGWEATPDVGDMSIPVSIQALLAARLEALPEDERATARRASVMGRSFESAALVEIDPARAAGMATQLAALVRKELLRPDRPELTAGDAFRFRHVLIRDAAYEALPKAERAVLHERFSDWLERAAGDRRAEVEEIVGYHLEQALGYRTDLGEWGEPVDALRDRAAAIYRSAGMRADRRGDTGSTVALLSRALALEPAAASGSDLARLALADALIAVTREGEARAILSDLRSRAAARGDLAIEARAAMLDLLARAGLADPALRTPEFEALAA